MSDEISFGEVEHSQPELHRRPDQNAHFAVVAVGEPDERELAIYIDVDTTLDIEQHATENTSIELGGVLLGGQYLDDAGRPFVMVTDAIRAEHYEATRGQFKFTHDTWNAIARQKERFPSGTEIVGWYHTHPDWGVFLSGMDMFICNEFFKRPLDVALVVDPCRQDRGWFHWRTLADQRASDGAEFSEGQGAADVAGESKSFRRDDARDPGPAKAEKRRNRGYYLYGSRFRMDELQQVAKSLIYVEGAPMVTTQRLTTHAGQTAPVIHLSLPDNRWQAIVLLSMLGLQTFLVAGLLIFLATQGRQPESQQTAKESAYQNVIAAILVAAQDSAGSAEMDDKKLQDRIDTLVKRQAEVDQLKAEKKAVALGVQGYVESAASLNKQLSAVNSKRMELETLLQRSRAELSDLQAEVASNSTLLEKAKSDGLIQWWQSWTNIAIAAVVVLGAGIGGAVGTLFWRGSQELFRDPAEVDV